MDILLAGAIAGATTWFATSEWRTAASEIDEDALAIESADGDDDFPHGLMYPLPREIVTRGYGVDGLSGSSGICPCSRGGHGRSAIRVDIEVLATEGFLEFTLVVFDPETGKVFGEQKASESLSPGDVVTVNVHVPEGLSRDVGYVVRDHRGVSAETRLLRHFAIAHEPIPSDEDFFDRAYDAIRDG